MLVVPFRVKITGLVLKVKCGDFYVTWYLLGVQSQSNGLATRQNYYYMDTLMPANSLNNKWTVLVCFYWYQLLWIKTKIPDEHPQGKIPVYSFCDIQYQVLLGFICKETYIYQHTHGWGGGGGGDEDIETCEILAAPPPPPP